ncbi:hypothetical protein Bbelb_275640 [Branchiostoma belcheri]|nr:hypothetical protein Bbelb_275640 [Branchiostoma belcheri]
MGEKLRHVLILLLIILTELNMPGAGRGCLKATRPNPTAIVTNTNTTAVVASDLDNQYEDIDQHDQAGQSQAIANHQYEDIDQRHQTGQGQSQAITDTFPKTPVTCDPDHQYENFNQHDQTGQGESKPLDATNPAYNVRPSAPQKNPQSLYKGGVKSQTNPKLYTKPTATATATAMMSGNDQAGQGPYQDTTQPLGNNMGEKLRHVLILLLIILTELNMPGAGRGRGCSTATRENCKIKDSLYRRAFKCCNYDGRTYPSIPQNLPWSTMYLDLTRAFSTLPILMSLHLSSNQITSIQSGTFSNLPRLDALHLKSNLISSIQPVSTSSSFDNIEINASPTTSSASSTSDTQPLVTHSETANNYYNGTTLSSYYHWHFKTNADSTAHYYVDITNGSPTTTLPITSESSLKSTPSYPLPVTIGYTTGPIVGIVLFGSIFFIIRWKRKIRNLPSGPSPKAILTNTNPTAVVASEHDNQFEDIDQHNQAGQSQTIANPKENSSSVVVTDHQYEDIDQHNQTGQSTSHTITEPSTVTAAVVVTCGADNQHDQTGQGQSQAITDSNTKTPVTCDLDHQYENFNQHDQTGQGEAQPFDVINPTYNIDETVPQRNPQSLYKGS